MDVKKIEDQVFQILEENFGFKPESLTVKYYCQKIKQKEISLQELGKKLNFEYIKNTQEQLRRPLA